MTHLGTLLSVTGTALLLTATGKIHAADSEAPVCRQVDAIYADTDGNFLLQFEEPGPDSAVVANLVTLTDLASEQSFEGDVIWNQGFSQPNVSVTFPCHAKGTPQPADEQCSYEAVLYTLTETSAGTIGMATLPGGSEPAARTLLLPHLARSWYYGLFQTGWSEHIPTETFVLTDCRAG